MFTYSHFISLKEHFLYTSAKQTGRSIDRERLLRWCETKAEFDFTLSNLTSLSHAFLVRHKNVPITAVIDCRGTFATS